VTLCSSCYLWNVQMQHGQPFPGSSRSFLRTLGDSKHY
jgi:hypothetical protein